MRPGFGPKVVLAVSRAQLRQLTTSSQSAKFYYLNRLRDSIHLFGSIRGTNDAMSVWSCSVRARVASRCEAEASPKQALVGADLTVDQPRQAIGFRRNLPADLSHSKNMPDVRLASHCMRRVTKTSTRRWATCTTTLRNSRR
jgi:hypothetical protein